MLGRLAPLFRLGLGARIGPGTQFISWITLTDHVRALRYLLANPGIEGPVNLTAPGPVTNAEFTAALAAALGRPALLRAPAAVLRAALGELSTDLLASARVLPHRLLEAGFTFRHADMASGLAAEFSSTGTARAAPGI
jgi:NAD dependent epimerase/dehydratase family enzyme